MHRRRWCRCSTVPRAQTKQTISAGNIASKRREKLVSRCQLLCLSRRFSFTHAWSFYQRGLIRIKCLKAFQTPGDLNNFWLDLQTKQTIMMQACVKMYTAVTQQMPALDVFINVFPSSFHQVFFLSPFIVLDLSTERGGGGGLCIFLLLQRCTGKKAGLKFMHSKTRKKRVIRRLRPGGNLRVRERELQRARRNQKYSNVLQSIEGKDNNPSEKVYFLGRYNKPTATPAASKQKGAPALSF